MRRLAITVALGLAVAASRGAAQQSAGLANVGDPTRISALVRADRQRLGYVPGEVLVKFREGVRPQNIAAALNVLSDESAAAQQDWMGGTLFLSGLNTDDSEHAAQLLALQPEVEYAQPNYLRSVHAIPNEPLYSRQWNMDQINMPSAWDIAPAAARGVIIAVLDTGLTTFTAITAVPFPVPPAFLTTEVFQVPFSRESDLDFSRVLPGAEFTITGPWTLSGQRVLFDTDGHGTHVAGTAVQWTNNHVGFAGVANGATLVPVKVCSSALDVMMAGGRDRSSSGAQAGCDDRDIALGLHYAADLGAQIINLSLGGSSGPAPVIRDALAYAVSRGSFVSLSAGNDALKGNPAIYPAAYASGIQGVVAVGAITPRRTRALYSSYGSYVELAAPGGEGGLDTCGADAEVVWQVGPDRFDLGVIPPRFDRYTEMRDCGTSMAAPHVAGAAALLFAQGIKSPAAIEAALEKSAVDLGPPGRDDEFGYGLIDVRAALRGLGVGR